ncbi:hypothetical protein, conserved [Eimeria brunetti]|uniref:Uncharacterized protein n=1 Tax=Eimeria brunetti TaxID=51314 RepID=U6LN33_9EIME|nr:hypothetical protein, conserved [Eimeria brunetti]
MVLFFQLLSPLEDNSTQWSVQFAYDIFNFLRENGFCCSLETVEDLLQALAAAVCPLSFDLSPFFVKRLFLSKAQTNARKTKNPYGLYWERFKKDQMQQQQQQQQQLLQQQQQQQQEEKEVLCLCIRASLAFLFDALDTPRKGYFDAADITEFWEAPLLPGDPVMVTSNVNLDIP